jgi:hypothetical protein
MSFLELISTVENRPYFLGERTIQSLDTFINGWFIGRGYGADNGVMSKFNKFVEKRYEITTTHGWARTINHHSRDSYDALNQFFKLFNEFKIEDAQP